MKTSVLYNKEPINLVKFKIMNGQKRNFLRMFLAGVLMLLSLTAYAQERTVTGKVYDAAGEPIIGASVVIQGTTQGIITDIDGAFQLKVQPSQTLVVSFLGYKDVILPVGNKNDFKITLEEDSKKLDEVVVVGYATQKKVNLTGSVASVSAKDIQDIPVANTTTLLQGRLPGLVLTQNGAQAGNDNPEIRIRGIGTFGNNNPMVLIDGVEGSISQIAEIPSADIESISVLKDAASTALYGARGANGIIMVTTKKGKMGKATVNFDAKWGSNSRAVKNYDVLESAQEYLEREYSAIYNTGLYNLNYDAAKANAYANSAITTKTNGGNGYQIYTLPEGQSLIGMDGKLNPNATLGYNDGEHYFTPDNWSDIMFNPTLRQEYNLSISGSTDRNNFYVSLGYLDDGGLVSGSGFERTSGRVKDDYQVNKWLKVGVNASFNYSKSFYPGDQTASASSGNAFMMANWIAPIYPMYVRDAQGNIMTNKGRKVFDYGTVKDAGRDRSFMSISNPAGQLAYDKTEYLMDILNANWYAEITPLAGLTLAARYGFSIDNTRYHALQNAYMGQFASMGGAVTQRQERTSGFNQQYSANYQFTLKEHHHFDLSAIYDGYTYKYERVSASGSYLYNPEDFFVDNAAKQKNGGGYGHERASIGYIGRVNYIAMTTSILPMSPSVVTALHVLLPKTDGVTSGRPVLPGC